MRQIALDTETTGLLYYNGHRIIEIGCVEIIDRKITGNFFHTYLNPKRKIDSEAKDITGLNEIFLEDKPVFSDIVNNFFNFLKYSDEIIIHNANFDINFINNELRLSDFKIKDLKSYFNIFDSLSFARKKHPGKRNNLNALCQRYNIDNKIRGKHGALIDAKLLAQLYLNMTSDQFEIKYYVNNLNVDSIILNFDLKILKANIQEIKEHVFYIRQIKENI